MLEGAPRRRNFRGRRVRVGYREVLRIAWSYGLPDSIASVTGIGCRLTRSGARPSESESCDALQSYSLRQQLSMVRGVSKQQL